MLTFRDFVPVIVENSKQSREQASLSQSEPSESEMQIIPGFSTKDVVSAIRQGRKGS